MKLEELLRVVRIDAVIGDIRGQEIIGIDIDSRLVKPNHLFVAIKGTQTDGHAYIPTAIQNGAIAIVCERLPEQTDSNVAYILVENTELVIGSLATHFYGNPTRRFSLVGVTGTNGKTTIATLLYDMFRSFGHKVGLVSTVCNYIDGKPISTDHTTPDAVTLNNLFSEMAKAGCEYVFMEVSSHAVAQHRIGGLSFSGGIFTNLTRDHLDYHKTVDNYLKAKKAFFDSLPKEAFALTNADDKNGMVMLQNTMARVSTYSLRSLSDFKGKVLEDDFDGMLFNVNGHEVNVPFVGLFNASNLLAVYGAACLLGKDSEDVLLALSVLRPVSGRFETIHSKRGYTAIVDYAHTPDALDNVLGTMREVMRGKGHIITVVGAGGNRDKGKRPLMARSAVRFSDKVIVTSDNPRFEEPQDIINDMMAGINPSELHKVLSVVEREEAIRQACRLAQPDDAILIAGKGHENYQDVKGVKHHFDDKEVLRNIFEEE
ncbi:MAG: UDP-N-acetylmuramoyl-L-alanyl-D-glutamate--2,6-diaminopimelate ligase [Bacteroidales bacterium]|nr:UDP-N-acetylmuramoyl-L-alanyl-D-glutamate--2,6-diaminopimelate ligase [Bacteroidales bacterium]